MLPRSSTMRELEKQKGISPKCFIKKEKDGINKKIIYTVEIFFYILTGSLWFYAYNITCSSMQFKKNFGNLIQLTIKKKYWHANKVSTFKSELKAIENLLLYTFIYIKAAVENFYRGEEEWMGWYF